MTLFREEVVARKVERLQGPVSLALPIGWHAIATFLTATLLVCGGFALTATYSKTQNVTGSIVPVSGVIDVVPGRPGRISTLMVAEGRHVAKGDVLAEVSTEEIDADGAGRQSGLLSEIDGQEAGLAAQTVAARAASDAARAEIDAQIKGLRSEISFLDERLQLQMRLIGMAEAGLASVREVAERGYISQRDLNGRQETLLSREQAMRELRQDRAAKVAGLEQLARAREQSVHKTSQDLAVLRSAAAQLARERTGVSADRGYRIVAPSSGVVSALSAHAGATVDQTRPVMQIVPASGALEAELLVPVRAIGSVRSGQQVRFLLDAYDDLGPEPVDSIIKSISAAPVLRPAADGKDAPFYIATASVGARQARSGLRSRPTAGMTLTAVVFTERRSVVQWMLASLKRAFDA